MLASNYPETAIYLCGNELDLISALLLHHPLSGCLLHTHLLRNSHFAPSQSFGEGHKRMKRSRKAQRLRCSLG